MNGKWNVSTRKSSKTNWCVHVKDRLLPHLSPWAVWEIPVFKPQPLFQESLVMLMAMKFGGLVMLSVPVLTLTQDWPICFKIQSCSELTGDFSSFLKNRVKYGSSTFLSTLVHFQSDKTLTLSLLFDSPKAFSHVALGWNYGCKSPWYIISYARPHKATQKAQAQVLM